MLKWVLGVMCVLTGCTVFSPTHYASNEKQQYLKSQNGADLVVPPPLSTTNISDFYHLPDQQQNARVSVTPPSQ